MAITINTNVWGTPETWVQVGATGAETKVTAFPRVAGYMDLSRQGTLIGGYLNNDIDLTDIDETICPWAIGKKADFLQGQFWLINPDGTNDLSPAHLQPTIQDFSFSDVAKRDAFPFFLGRHDNAGFRGYHHAHDSIETISAAADRQSWFDIAPYPTVYSDYGVAPFTTFNYNKLLCKPVAIFITQYNKTDFDAIFTDGYKDNGTSSPSYTTTLYAVEDITDEIINNYYCVGIYFYLYGENPNPGDNNSPSTYAFSILEKNAFPPLETVSGGAFGGEQHFPVTILGNSWGQHRQGCLIGDLFAEMQTGSRDSEIYTAANFANLPSTSYTQPKFWGGSSDKWHYYGYFSIRGNRYTSWGGNYCFPIFTWNGGNAAALKSYIMEQAAYLGFIFTDSDSSNVWNKKGGWDGTGDNEYLPIFDSNGYTTGRYVHGTDAAAESNSAWGSDVWEKTQYSGTPEINLDPNEYDETNTSVLNPDYTKRNFKFNKGYLLTDAQVNTLAAKCFELVTGLTTAPDFIQELFTKLLSGNEPMDAIISLMFFPFNPAKYFVTTPSSANIMFGALDTGISAKEWENTIIELDMGGCTFYPENGDFRDFEPYTACELYLPYLGNVTIDSQLYLGHEITVKYIVDLCTGAVDALIFRDGFRADKVSGNIGEQIAIHGIDQNDKLTAEQRAHVGYKQARNTQIQKTASAALTIAGGAAAVATGGATAILGGIAAGITGGLKLSEALEGNSVERAKFDLEHIQTPYRTIGKASAATAYRDEQFCRLIIKRPKMLNSYNAANYAHTTGFATLKHDRLGNYTGLVVANNVDLSGFNATAEEKKAISNLLSKGVYL